MGELKKWRDENWVRIGTDGKIKGPCGTSKKQKKILIDVCLWLKLKVSLSESFQLQLERKRKKERKENNLLKM